MSPTSEGNLRTAGTKHGERQCLNNAGLIEAAVSNCGTISKHGSGCAQTAMRLARRQPKETRSQRCAQRSTSLSDRAKARDGQRICHRIRTPTDPSQCDVTVEMTCISDSRLDDIVTSELGRGR